MALMNLELIGIHIKKTAGMSFKLLLKRQYGRKYYRLNINQEIENRKEVFEEHLGLIPEDTRVIHGHFFYEDALPLYSLYPDVPILTWLREPVQRVISSYYYSQRKYRDGDQPEKTYMEHYSLLDYARDERYRNEMARVLHGTDLADLAFVGIMEYLEEDLAYLSSLLEWSPYKIPERNINKSYKAKNPIPTDAEIAEIVRLNQDDIKLYRYALELRAERTRISFPGRKTGRSG